MSALRVGAWVAFWAEANHGKWIGMTRGTFRRPRLRPRRDGVVHSWQIPRQYSEWWIGRVVIRHAYPAPASEPSEQ